MINKQSLYQAIDLCIHHHCQDTNDQTIKELANKLTNTLYDELNSDIRRISCVYCGYCYPEHVSDTKHPLLYEHIQKCDKHPVGRMINKITSLRNDIGSRIGLAAKNDDSQTVSNFCWLVTELDKIIQEP